MSADRPGESLSSGRGPTVAWVRRRLTRPAARSRRTPPAGPSPQAFGLASARVRRTVGGPRLAALALVLALAACSGGPGTLSTEPAASDDLTVRVGALTGPTGMGLAALIRGQVEGEVGPVTVAASIVGTPDEITPALVRGELDAALVPANLAAVLQARTDGGVRAAAVTTLGVLSVVEAGDSVHRLDDLKGRALLTTGRGATPQYVMDFLLARAGLAGQVGLDYRSEPAEVVAALVDGRSSLGVLPEPYVSIALAKDPGLRVALDLTAQWEELAPGSQLVTGVLVVRRQFAEDRPEALRRLLDGYAASVAFTRDHPQAAAQGIAALGIVPDAAVAEAAIPRCHIVALTGQAMRTALSGYLQVLYRADPASVGGALPPDSFYEAA